MIKWKWFIVEGILLCVFGIFAIAQPEIAAVALEQLLGWLLVFVGGLAILGGVTAQAGPRVPTALIGGVLSLVCGLFLLLLPGIALATATVIIAVFFILTGGAEISSSFALRSVGGHANHWGIAFFQGIMSVILGVILLAYWPDGAILGLLLGINFLFSGSYLFTLGFYFKNAPTH